MRQLLIVSVLLVQLPAGASAQDKRRELIEQCVKQEIANFQNDSRQRISASGEVTCPAASLVGFPPAERKHNRAGTIELRSGSERMICGDSVPRVEQEHSNGGWTRNVEINADRSLISMQYGCNGANLTQGRRWWNGTLVAESCARATEEILLDFTLLCASKLE